MELFNDENEVDLEPQHPHHIDYDLMLEHVIMDDHEMLLLDTLLHEDFLKHKHEKGDRE